MQEIGKYLQLEEDSIGPPLQYLGGKLQEVIIANDQECWAWGSKQYVQAAMDNVQEYLGKRGQSFPAKAPMPMASKYYPS